MLDNLWSSTKLEQRLKINSQICQNALKANFCYYNFQASRERGGAVKVVLGGLLGLARIKMISYWNVPFLNWLWKIEICKLEFVWRWFWYPEITYFEFHQPVFKKIISADLNIDLNCTNSHEFLNNNFQFWFHVFLYKNCNRQTNDQSLHSPPPWSKD